MEKDERDNGSTWGLANWLIAFPLAAVATYLVRTRLGWGAAGWEDAVAYVGFSLTFMLLVEAGRDLLHKRRRDDA